MRPILSAVELAQVQEIRIDDVRSIAEHKPPGKDGSYLQDLGRHPTRLTILGVVSDPNARTFIEDLKAEMRAGKPVPFVSDITSDTELRMTIIDDVGVRQLAGKPDRFGYAITLHEYVEPAVPETAALFEADILDDAAALLDNLVDGLDLAAAFATGLERFTGPLGDLLTRLTTFREQLEATP